MNSISSYILGSRVLHVLHSLIPVIFILSCLVSASVDSQAQAQSAAGKAPAKSSAASTPPAASENGLKSRIESLEEQLVDMQVVIGTLESLAKSGGGQASSGYRSASGGGAETVRVDSLESQVRQLSSQVQQLSDQVRSLGGTPRRSEVVPPPASGGFGATTVTEGSDQIGGLIANDAPTAEGFNTPQPVATGALPPASDGADPKQMYETAYGYLLQRDYGAAETAFGEFLTRFPSDSLSGNAQYWLGETHFVRGQYKAAANAFLKGYQSYAQSPKAADSLLKLAMSLDRLGQKDAACSSYSELNTRFPNAPQSVKTRAQSERQRVGCT